jgi:hypothetical protein
MIITLQEYFGFTLNVDKAIELKNTLVIEQFNINRKLQQTFTPIFLPEKLVEKPKKPIRRKMYLPNEKYIPLLGS